jgi:hypothetical protein
MFPEELSGSLVNRRTSAKLLGILIKMVEMKGNDCQA